MKKLVSIFAGFCVASLIAGSAIAETPSAKFAATWTTVPGLASVADLSNISTDTIAPLATNSGYTLTTIKVPQDKELLVGVSAEIGLITDTSIKGRLGGAAKAIADAKASVILSAVPRDGGEETIAAPGEIMLSSRFQELDATLGGVIQSCQVPCEEQINDTTGLTEIVCDDIIIATDCIVTDEEIGMLLNTTAAHHFNFVLPNLDQGVYDIKAHFFTGAGAEVKICDEFDECNYDAEGIVEASAYAKAIINKTMVTVQQVRAANTDELIDATFTTP